VNLCSVENDFFGLFEGKEYCELNRFFFIVHEEEENDDDDDDDDKDDVR